VITQLWWRAVHVRADDTADIAAGLRVCWRLHVKLGKNKSDKRGEGFKTSARCARMLKSGSVSMRGGFRASVCLRFQIAHYTVC